MIDRTILTAYAHRETPGQLMRPYLDGEYVDYDADTIPDTFEGTHDPTVVYAPFQSLRLDGNYEGSMIAHVDTATINSCRMATLTTIDAEVVLATSNVRLNVINGILDDWIPVGEAGAIADISLVRSTANISSPANINVRDGSVAYLEEGARGVVDFSGYKLSLSDVPDKVDVHATSGLILVKNAPSTTIDPFLVGGHELTIVGEVEEDSSGALRVGGATVLTGGTDIIHRTDNHIILG